ncbi:YqiA/YcfP family alpha/beta fold hydrolase [Pseudomonas sp. SO81]|uniref:YqiA/YcfP family alpha/beta fold hydrolase n=1 Tax=Pseudomonas sp. SO81 TaxID=2983246 RepID=UPI0025A496DC|nr:YqiA/YcfP family alpha/beta fold hydrolase [Pseudomonas sp. SO81]WJN60215.1 Esterase YqiA [Pseudomonas sp. SO81]
MNPSILYIHGLNSSPASTKASQLLKVAEHCGIAQHLRVPALHHHPRQAMQQLQAAIAELGRPLLVGSSLGGYYSTFLAEQHGLPALLINPAVRPHRLFGGKEVEQTNYYTNETWLLTHDHVAALQELEVAEPRDAARYHVWLQTADETLDYRQAEAFYAGCSLDIQQGGDHSYQGFARRIPEILALAGFAPALWADFDFSTL